MRRIKFVFCERRKNFEHNGRGEHVGDVELLNSIDDFGCVRLAWDGEGDIGDDGGDSEQGVDKGVEREGGQVDLIRCDVEGVL